MSRNIKTRIEALENKITYRHGLIPGLVYISGLPDSKTFEEAKAEYKQQHSFDLPGNAPVLELVLESNP